LGIKKPETSLLEKKYKSRKFRPKGQIKKDQLAEKKLQTKKTKLSARKKLTKKVEVTAKKTELKKNVSSRKKSDKLLKKNSAKKKKKNVNKKAVKKKTSKKVLAKKKIVKKKIKVSQKSKSIKSDPRGSSPKPIGVITHYFGKISVGIIELSASLSSGETITIKGADTDFTQKIVSMQVNHRAVDYASKGDQIGIKVRKKVHVNDKVYLLKK